MTGGTAHATKKQPRIEIIPLIDVVFFLLATFVLFTLSLSKIVNIPIDLPVATPSTPQNKEDDTSVTLQVSEAGTLYWNQEPITMAEVAPRLQNYVANEPDPRVLLASDDRAKYGPAITVLDEVRKVGIKKVSIETVYRPTGR
jgi:biopolymer transport protein ExbD